MAQDLEVMLKLRDLLSKQIRQQTLPQTKALNQEFLKMTKGLIAGGLAALGLSIGFKSFLATVGEISAAGAKVQFAILNLGPAAVQAYKEMEPQFQNIASAVDATRTQVETAYAILVQASGKPIQSTKDLMAAFYLAKAAGVDFKTAAEAIGLAQIGMVEPLRQLTGPFGFKSLQQVEDDAAKSFQSNRTIWEITMSTLQRSWQDFVQTISGNPPEITKDFWGGIVKGFADWLIAPMRDNWNFWWATLSTPVEAAWNMLSPTLDKIGKAAAAMWGGLESGWSAAWGVVKGIVEGALNGVIGAINVAIRLIDKIPGVNIPQIPTMGQETPGTPANPQGGLLGGTPGRGYKAGGIFTKPTWGLIGEAGPEAVVPLSRGGAALGGHTFNISIGTVDSEARSRQVTREIKRLLQEDSRRGLRPF